jgi:hypothetical protein
MRRSTRLPDLLAAAAVTLSCVTGGGARAVALTPPPTGLYAQFTGCPVDNPAFLAAANDPNGGGGICIWGQTTDGELAFGTTVVPIVNPILLQGGNTLDSTDTINTWWDASPPSQTLADPGQPVPGGLDGNPSDTSPNNSVTAVTELAGPNAVQFNFNNLLFQTTPGIQLSVKFHLINPLLGPTCFIGSDSDPIVLNLTDGTTSPPPPNTPISGNIADLTVLDGGNLVTVGVLDLVDNAFAGPTANGCGSGDALDALVNARAGLPSPAGTNTAILNGISALALPSSVLATIPAFTSVNCSPNPFAPGDTTCTAMVTAANSDQGTPTGTVSFTNSGAGSFGGGGSCTLTETSSGVASCPVTFTSLALGSQTITASYSGDAGNAASSGPTTVTVAVPASTVGCRLRAHGQILATNGDTARFSVSARATPLKGKQKYNDNGPADASKVRSLSVDAVTCSADTTSIFGQASINKGGSFLYRIDVQQGTYRIRLDNGYDSGAQQIQHGGVRVHHT